MVATRRGNDDQALDFFRQAVSAGGYPDPVERTELYFELARLTSAAGDPAAAVEAAPGVLERIRRESPDELDAIARYAYVLSYAYTDAGDYAAAAACSPVCCGRAARTIGLDLRATVLLCPGPPAQHPGQLRAGASVLPLLPARSAPDQGRRTTSATPTCTSPRSALAGRDRGGGRSTSSGPRLLRRAAWAPIDEGDPVSGGGAPGAAEERADDGRGERPRAVELLASGAAVRASWDWPTWCSPGAMGARRRAARRRRLLGGDRAPAAPERLAGRARPRLPLVRRFLRRRGRNEAALDACASAADVGEGLPET